MPKQAHSATQIFPTPNPRFPMVRLAPSPPTRTTATDPDADHPSPPSRLLSKHRPRRRAAPPRPTLPPPAPTRGQPDLNRCSCCLVRLPPPPPGAKRHPIRPLRSLWRIVLLCSECLSLLRAAAVCSYCLSLDNLPSEDSAVTCRSCSRCVHHHCILAEHRMALVQPIDLEDFVCVDCCPTVKPGRRNVDATSAPKLELAIREPHSAVRGKREALTSAKLNSPKKAVPVSKCSKEVRALIAIGGESQSNGDPDLPDEKLALQLHLAMNGSQRISRSGSASGIVSAGQAKVKKGLVSGRKVNEDLGLCVTNMMDHLDYGENVAEMQSNWSAKHVMGFDPSVTVVLALEYTGKYAEDCMGGKRKGPPGTNQHDGLVDRYQMKYTRKSSKQANAESTGNRTMPNGNVSDSGDF
ncbi:uncharacterized protein [Lolium perenne]|uniref:uncharacterized protein isoform X3 n=1 Tax=Lolium perenne TaxID=4522 RepID=UPI0021F58637|nr:uncharacterized protein LOC127316962 isoform X3 [Lolium perenne]XP_051203424.1 uncharacterized protein LOC127316962 isoform X3 [Lolium perenne]XP_051203425.1 uncharacterized protein LOC127316962 isoform X3 [Lolium perenne]